MKTSELTKREQEMLVKTVDTYFDGDREGSGYTECICEDSKANAAILGSLVKKGVMDRQGRGREATCSLTNEGKILYWNLKGRELYPLPSEQKQL